jgi:NADPH2:quinone reductase
MVFDRFGGPDVMSLRDVPVPEPQNGEMLIRVSYSGVNPADSKTRSGATRAHYRYVDFPLVTGMDAAGVSRGSRDRLGLAGREDVGQLC